MPKVTLASFLQKDRILFGLKSTGQIDTLKQMISLFVRAGIVDDGDDSDLFLHDLLKREAEITTVMDNGIAIPHARSHVVKKLGLVVGITGKEGILFHEENSIRSRIIFCIAVPIHAPTCHISLLQTIALFARDEKRIDKVLQYKTVLGVCRYLSSV